MIIMIIIIMNGYPFIDQFKKYKVYVLTSIL